MPTPHHPNTRVCAYMKVDGKRCGTPAWQDFDHCWHHHGLKARWEAQQFSFPALDDANAVQVATMDVINALITHRIDRADAYALFYGLYLAKSNLKATTLCPPTPNDLEEMLEKARREGLAAGREQGRLESERARSKQTEEHEESLAALLLRELSENPPPPIGSENEDPTAPEKQIVKAEIYTRGKEDIPTKGEWWTNKKTG